MSRHAAARKAHGREIEHSLREQGIVARGRIWKGLAEEQPDAYKDLDVVVVNVVEKAGLAKKVARLRPIGVIKGSATKATAMP
jgi:tRNA-splicing ligase RtcB